MTTYVVTVVAVCVGMWLVISRVNARRPIGSLVTTFVGLLVLSFAVVAIGLASDSRTQMYVGVILAGHVMWASTFAYLVCAFASAEYA